LSESELIEATSSVFQAAGGDNHIQAQIAKSVCSYLTDHPRNALNVIRGQSVLGNSQAWIHACTIIDQFLTHYEMSATIATVNEENDNNALPTDPSLLTRITFARYMSDLLRRRKRQPRFAARVVAYATRIQNSE
jgi:hypothetical protein